MLFCAMQVTLMSEFLIHNYLGSFIFSDHFLKHYITTGTSQVLDPLTSATATTASGLKEEKGAATAAAAVSSLTLTPTQGTVTSTTLEEVGVFCNFFFLLKFLIVTKISEEFFMLH